MALTLNAFASNTSSASTTVTLTLPGTPQAGDRYVVVALGFRGSSTSWSLIPTSGPTLTEHENAGDGVDGRVWLGSRDWQSGDGTTVTFTANPTPKHLFVCAWLLRPGSGNTVAFVTSAEGGGSSSGSTDTISLSPSHGSGAVDAVAVSAHANDDKQTAYSNWNWRAAADLTEDVETSAGSGSPANWSSFGAASAVVTDTAGTDDTLQVTHDDTAEPWSMVAGVFEEVTSGDVPKSGTDTAALTAEATPDLSITSDQVDAGSLSAEGVDEISLSGITDSGALTAETALVEVQEDKAGADAAALTDPTPTVEANLDALADSATLDTEDSLLEPTLDLTDTAALTAEATPSLELSADVTDAAALASESADIGLEAISDAATLSDPEPSVDADLAALADTAALTAEAVDEIELTGPSDSATLSGESASVEESVGKYGTDSATLDTEDSLLEPTLDLTDTAALSAEGVDSIELTGLSDTAALTAETALVEVQEDKAGADAAALSAEGVDSIELSGITDAGSLSGEAATIEITADVSDTGTLTEDAVVDQGGDKAGADAAALTDPTPTVEANLDALADSAALTGEESSPVEIATDNTDTAALTAETASVEILEARLVTDTAALTGEAATVEVTLVLTDTAGISELVTLQADLTATDTGTLSTEAADAGPQGDLTPLTRLVPGRLNTPTHETPVGPDAITGGGGVPTVRQT